MSTAAVEEEINQGVEVHRFFVAPHNRKVVSHPSGKGFYTVDRNQGSGNKLLVISYLINPEDLAHDGARIKTLSDWESSLSPSRHMEPTKVVLEGVDWFRFTQEWSKTVEEGSGLSVETFREQTPVTMVFQTR